MAQPASTPNNDPVLTIPMIAREALEAAGGDAVKATAIMDARIDKDPTLYRELLDPLRRTACYNAITHQCAQQRRAIWHTPQPNAETQRRQITALASGTMATLMDFPLPGGLRLADARRDDVVAAAELYRKQSSDMGGKAKWLQLIAQHVTGKKTVKQVMTDARLTELREEATRE